VSDLISGAAVTEFFRDGFQHAAWRLEVRRTYDVDYSSARFRQFMRGEDPGVTGLEEWMDLMKALTGDRKRIERVRLFDEPPTDYQRFMLHTAVHNVAAGEDIRYLTRAAAQRLELPMVDVWLFDSREIGVFRYDGDRSLGMELQNDPEAVLRICQARDAAWHYAMPYDVFRSQVPSAV
jgi:hypothetical protein